MSVNKSKYRVGQAIICTTVPESCLITAIDKNYKVYKIKWLLQSDPAFNLLHDRMSFFVAHKYFKKIEDVKLEELTWRDSKLAT